MLKLNNIFKLLLLVSILLTSKVLSAQSVNTHISTYTRVMNPFSHHVNHDESFIFEDNDISENTKIFNNLSFVDNAKSYCYDFGLVKKNFPQVVLQKITTPFHRFTHLFIFFHCWKILFR